MFWNKKKPESPKGPALACVHHGVCSKDRCPLWVSLNVPINKDNKMVDNFEGRCTLAWTPQLLIELRGQITALAAQKHQVVD